MGIKAWGAGLAIALVLASPAHAAETPPPAAPPAKPAPAGTAASPSAIGGAGSGPIQVTADGGLEMQQANKAYIARVNAVATRGDRTLRGDTITAYYRDLPNSSQTEIWRIVSDGHASLATPDETVSGDHGVYDLDSKIVVMTGKHLQLETPDEVVTARDSLEWYDDKQFAVARGNALAVREDRRLRGDILTAQVTKPPGQGSKITRIDGAGHVIVSRPGQVGTGDKGVYNLETGIVTLTGNVVLTRGESSMAGAYGVVDLNNNVSRLLPAPAGSGTPGGGRVEAYVVPRDGQHAAGQGGGSANKSGASEQVQKAQPNTAKAR